MVDVSKNVLKDAHPNLYINDIDGFVNDIAKNASYGTSESFHELSVRAKIADMWISKHGREAYDGLSKKDFEELVTNIYSSL